MPRELLLLKEGTSMEQSSGPLQSILSAKHFWLLHG